MFQGAYLGHEFFHIPGSEILKWFSHQSVGTSLNLQGPLDFIGVIVCAVFVFRKHRPLPTPPGDLHIIFIFPIMLWDLRFLIAMALFFTNSLVRLVHLTFGWNIFPLRISKGNQATNWVKSMLMDLVRLMFKLKLKVQLGRDEMWGSLGIQARHWRSQTNIVGSSRCSITPYEDDLDDSAKDTKIKCSHDDFDGDEAGPSGEDTNREEDIQHSKRIWLPDLIERFIPHLRNWIGNSSTQEGDSDCKEEKSQWNW